MKMSEIATKMKRFDRDSEAWMGYATSAYIFYKGRDPDLSREISPGYAAYWISVAEGTSICYDSETGKRVIHR